MRRFAFFATTFIIPLVLLFAVLHLNKASRRVAFLGDSLTQGWAFPRENYGVFGQTTAQMTERFQREIPGHQTVIILGGTNDTLLGINPAITIANLSSMIDMARSDGSEPILAEIPPIYRSNGKYLDSVEALDREILLLGEKKRVPVVDYYTALAGHLDAYSDGVHLKRRGYLRMELALLKVRWVL